MTDHAKLLSALRARCVVIYYHPHTGGASLGSYPIEHNPAAQKDNWDTIVALLTEEERPR